MSRKVTVKENERSWAITIISDINSFVKDKGLSIKRADGEKTVNTGKKRMFPDVILYADADKKKLLQGWEIKMPDVAITDSEFHADAVRKAVNLGLNSFVKWNFSYVELYVENAGRRGKFERKESWDLSEKIKTRADVETYKAEWGEQLESVISEVDSLIRGREVKPANLSDVVSEHLMATVIGNNKGILAEHLEVEAGKNASMRAELDYWWDDTKAEYLTDESDVWHAYSKMLLLDWLNKMLFANTLKGYQMDAEKVEGIDETTTPEEAQEIFRDITAKCDFFSIFNPELYSEKIPDVVWDDLVSFNNFIKDTTIVDLDTKALQNVLENTVAVAKREVVGQFTTPERLAELLTALTIDDLTGDVIDPCCGTGTIPKMAIRVRESHIGKEELARTTWASDKMSFPLQIANLNIAQPEAINVPNRVVQKNVFSLETGESVEIVNPTDGTIMTVEVPEFSTIVSNLPFVNSNTDRGEEAGYRERLQRKVAALTGVTLKKKLDTYGYIVLKLKELLKEKGRVGVITSNSWFGTESGEQFFEVLPWFFKIKGIVTEGPDRWFKNAKVKGTILVLENKENGEPDTNEIVAIGKVKKDIDDLEDMEIKGLVRAFHTDREYESDSAELKRYTLCEINRFREKNISINALFHSIDWFWDVSPHMVPIKSRYAIVRGVRTGQDKIFYILKKKLESAGTSAADYVDEEFIIEGVKSSKSVTESLYGETDMYVVDCGKTLQELEEEGYEKTHSWFKLFEGSLNASSKKRKENWTKYPPAVTATMTVGMNPGNRLFVAKYDPPVVINQRLVGLSAIDSEEDDDLNHALLNSIMGLFYIEGIGFGRGEGALDYPKDKYGNGYMLDPGVLDKDKRETIKELFLQVANRPLMSLDAELEARDRELFDRAVLAAYGLEHLYESIKESLLSIFLTRKGNSSTNSADTAERDRDYELMVKI